MKKTHRGLKNAIYEQFARLGKAVSAPKRLELLDLLSQGPRTVEPLAHEAGMSIANASQHLKVLRGARLVEARKKGLHVEYRLAADDVGVFFVALRDLARSRLVEVEQTTRAYLQSPGTMEAIAGEELLRRVDAGEVTVVDVRPSSEYWAGHIEGAVSIPIEELRARLGELPDDRKVVAYCRGPYCVMAVEAVEILRESGFDAFRMEQGITEWRAGGHSVVGHGEGS